MKILEPESMFYGKLQKQHFTIQLMKLRHHPNYRVSTMKKIYVIQFNKSTILFRTKNMGGVKELDKTDERFGKFIEK